MSECQYLCRLFNLETPKGREEYAQLMTEIFNNKYLLMKSENIMKRLEDSTPDTRSVEVQLWKLVEYKIEKSEPKPGRTQKFTYEESL